MSCLAHTRGCVQREGLRVLGMAGGVERPHPRTVHRVEVQTVNGAHALLAFIYLLQEGPSWIKIPKFNRQ